MLTKTGPTGSSERCKTLNAAAATVFNEMCRVFPFFDFGIAIDLRTRSTRLQTSLYCSLGLMPVLSAISNSGDVLRIVLETARNRDSSSVAPSRCSSFGFMGEN